MRHRRAPPASSSGGGALTTASSPRIFRPMSPTSSPACTRSLELATLARCYRLSGPNSMHFNSSQVMMSIYNVFARIWMFITYICVLINILYFFFKELAEHQRSDAVSSMVYEASARVRDPVYGCVGAISHLQQQIEALRAQLALAEAEVVHLRVHHGASTNPINDSSHTSPYPKPSFHMDMSKEQPSFRQSMWSCT